MLSRCHNTGDALAVLVSDLEAAGERVVQVIPWGGEFLVLTASSASSTSTPPAKRPAAERQKAAGGSVVAIRGGSKTPKGR